MAGAKVFARRALSGAAIIGFFAAWSGLAYAAAGVALDVGRYVGAH